MADNREELEDITGVFQGRPQNEIVSEDGSSLQEDDRNSMKRHNKQYDDLLKGYVSNANRLFYLKFVCKIIMFVFSIACLTLVLGIAIAFLALTALGIVSLDLVNVASFLGTFLSVFIIIPKVMSHYLFDKDEEGNMAQIVENIQKHDEKIRDDIQEK